jgi:hypothetical protein
MTNTIIWKKILALSLAIVLFANPILWAQEELSDYALGKLDGERDAKGNPLWFLAGFGCGIFGVGAAYLIKPEPPAHALMGKSSEYVLGYTEGYQNKSRTQNAMYALGGMAAGCLLFLAMPTPSE